MLSILMLGFIIGMRHALEADHLAAVSTIASQNLGIKRAWQMGSAWGLGHTITLFIFGGIVLMVGGHISEEISSALEMAVGVMLILLGADVIRRLIVNRVHYHVHRHGDDTPHFHAHSHRNDKKHNKAAHHHQHGFPTRALFIGLIHGMAGSAALIAITLESVESIPLGIAYITLFGLGSIVGMALLASIIAIPLPACKPLCIQVSFFAEACNGIAIMLANSAMPTIDPRPNSVM